MNTSGTILPLLEWQLTDFSLSTESTAGKSTLNCSLQQIVVLELLKTKFSSLQLLASAPPHRFLEAKLKRTPKKESMVVNMGILSSVLSRTTAAGLIQFIAELSQLIIEFAIEHKIGFFRKKKKKAVKRNSVYHISLRAINATILKGTEKFLLVNLLDLNFRWVEQQSLLFSLQGFNIQHPPEFAVWPHLINIQSKTTEAGLKVNFLLHKKRKELDGWDGVLEFHLSPTKIVFIRSVFSYLKSYFQNFLPTVEVYVTSIKEQVEKYKSFLPPPEPSPVPRIEIKLDLETPTIIIPRGPQSEEHILINLGVVNLTSAFSVKKSVEIVSYVADMKQVEIQAHFKQSRGVTEPFRLIKDTILGITVEVPILGNEKHQIPDLNVAVSVSSMEFSVGGSPAIFLCLVATSNILDRGKFYDEELTHISDDFLTLENSLFSLKKPVEEVIAETWDKTHVSVQFDSLKLSLLSSPLPSRSRHRSSVKLKNPTRGFKRFPQQKMCEGEKKHPAETKRKAGTLPSPKTETLPLPETSQTPPQENTSSSTETPPPARKKSVSKERLPTIPIQIRKRSTSSDPDAVPKPAVAEAVNSLRRSRKRSNTTTESTTKPFEEVASPMDEEQPKRTSSKDQERPKRSLERKSPENEEDKQPKRTVSKDDPLPKRSTSKGEDRPKRSLPTDDGSRLSLSQSLERRRRERSPENEEQGRRSPTPEGERPTGDRSPTSIRRSPRTIDSAEVSPDRSPVQSRIRISSRSRSRDPPHTEEKAALIPVRRKSSSKSGHSDSASDTPPTRRTKSSTSAPGEQETADSSPLPRTKKSSGKSLMLPLTVSPESPEVPTRDAPKDEKAKSPRVDKVAKSPREKSSLPLLKRTKTADVKDVPLKKDFSLDSITDAGKRKGNQLPTIPSLDSSLDLKSLQAKKSRPAIRILPVEDPQNNSSKSTNKLMVVQLSFTNLQLDFRCTNQERTNFRVVLTDVNFRANENSKDPIKTQLSFHRPGTRTYAVKIKGSTKNKKTTIEIDSTQVVVVPCVNTFEHVFNFLFEFKKQLTIVRNEFNLLQKVHQRYVDEVSEKRPQARRSKLSVALSMTTPTFIFLSKFDEAVTPAVLFNTGDFNFKYSLSVRGKKEKETIEASVKKFSLYRSLLDCGAFQTLSKVPLLYPMGVDYRENRLVLDKIVIKISSEDLLVGLDIINSWTPLLALFLNQREIVAKTLSALDQRDKIPKRDQILDIEAGGIDIKLMDDTTCQNWDRNVLCFNVESLKVKLRGDPQKLTVGLQVYGLGIDSFNWDKFFWEPTIEKSNSELTMNFALTQKTPAEIAERPIIDGIVVGPTVRREVKLAQTSPILVNLAPSFIKAVSYLSDELLEPTKRVFENLEALFRNPEVLPDPLPKPDRPKSPPILLRNHLGADLIVWIQSEVDPILLDLSTELDESMSQLKFKTQAVADTVHLQLLQVCGTFAQDFKLKKNNFQVSVSSGGNVIASMSMNKHETWDDISFELRQNSIYNLEISSRSGLVMGRLVIDGSKYLEIINQKIDISDVFSPRAVAEFSLVAQYPKRFYLPGKAYMTSVPVTPQNRVVDAKIGFTVVNGSATSSGSLEWAEEGCVTFLETATSPSDCVVVSIATQEEKERKVLTFRSSASFSNATMFPLHLQIKGSTTQFEILLPPNSDFGCPLHIYALESFDLFISPDKTNFPWQLWKTGQNFVTCSPRKGKKRTYLAIERDVTRIIRQGPFKSLPFSDWILEFHPTLIIQNGLASPIGVELSASSQKPSKEVLLPWKSVVNDYTIIQPLKTSHELELPCPTEDLAVSFFVQGFEGKSEPCKISSFVRATEEIVTSVKIKTSNGETLKLNVSRNKYDPSAGDLAISIVVFCPIWILNHTGLPLYYNNNKIPKSNPYPLQRI